MGRRVLAWAIPTATGITPEASRRVNPGLPSFLVLGWKGGVEPSLQSSVTTVPLLVVRVPVALPCLLLAGGGGTCFQRGPPGLMCVKVLQGVV